MMVSARWAASMALVMFSLLPVDSVGEDDEGFAALLFGHELVGGEEGGVVEGGASAVVGAASAVAVGIVRGVAGWKGWSVDFLEGGLKFGAGVGEVLQEFDWRANWMMKALSLSVVSIWSRKVQLAVRSSSMTLR